MSRLEKLKTLLEKEPDDQLLNFGLAMEFAKLGQPEEALGAFDRLLEKHPGYSAAYHHKGNVLIGLGRIDEARQILKRGVDVTRENRDPHAQREMQELLDTLA